MALSRTMLCPHEGTVRNPEPSGGPEDEGNMYENRRYTTAMAMRAGHVCFLTDVDRQGTLEGSGAPERVVGVCWPVMT